MIPITNPNQTSRLRGLIMEMMVMEEGEECEFNPKWIRAHNWKVVPAESMARLPEPDIPRIVRALKAANYHEGVAIYNEPGSIQAMTIMVESDPPDILSTCYQVSVNEGDFLELNRVFGPFRFLLTTETRSWAISCNEWYNLFAGPSELLEAMLGKSIPKAREKYLSFATALAKGPNEPLLEVARRYADL